MLSSADHFYLQQPEPNRSCLLALRAIIFAQDDAISTAWKYGMPFFCYREKRFCYLWVHKKYQKPYIGLVDGLKIQEPELLAEKRSRMKILLIDPLDDLPLELISSILQQAIALIK